jgi:hypothetical protein
MGFGMGFGMGWDGYEGEGAGVWGLIKSKKEREERDNRATMGPERRGRAAVWLFDSILYEQEKTAARSFGRSSRPKKWEEKIPKDEKTEPTSGKRTDNEILVYPGRTGVGEGYAKKKKTRNRKRKKKKKTERDAEKKETRFSFCFSF